MSTSHDRTSAPSTHIELAQIENDLVPGSHQNAENDRRRAVSPLQSKRQTSRSFVARFYRKSVLPGLLEVFSFPLWAQGKLHLAFWYSHTLNPGIASGPFDGHFV